MKIIHLSTFIFLSCMGFCKASSCYIYPKNDDSTKFSSIMAGFDYTSNNSSFGKFSQTKQPSYSSYISFFSLHNFNLGISGTAIDNTDSTATKFTYQYDLNLGYNWEIRNFISFSASYTHYLYSKNSFSLNSIYNNEFMVGADFNWKALYANSSIYYLMGDKNEWMNSFNIGANFDFNNILFKGHSISISPDISAIMSNQQYYNQYAYKTYWYLVLLARRRPELTIQKLYNNPEQYPTLWNFLNQRPRRLQEFSQLDKSLVISDLFNVESNYNISSVSATLPLYYNIGNLSLSFIYSATFPMNVPEYLDNSTVHYFSAGLMYSFML